MKKQWGQLYHAAAFELMAEVERLDPESLVLAKARRTFEIGETLGIRARGRPTSEAAQRHRDALIERIAERDRVDERVATLYTGGCSLLSTGKAIGKSPGWVVNSLDRQGIPARPRGGASAAISSQDMQRVARIKRWREEGQNLEEIGSRLNLSRERVRQICIRNGIDTKRSEELKPEQKQAVAEYVAGSSLNEVAERHGASTPALRNWILRAGYMPRSKPHCHSEEVKRRASRVAMLYQQGHSAKRIADEVGLAKAEMIYRYLAIAGVHPNRVFAAKAAA